MADFYSGNDKYIEDRFSYMYQNIWTKSPNNAEKIFVYWLDNLAQLYGDPYFEPIYGLDKETVTPSLLQKYISDIADQIRYYQNSIIPSRKNTNVQMEYWKLIDASNEVIDDNRRQSLEHLSNSKNPRYTRQQQFLESELSEVYEVIAEQVPETIKKMNSLMFQIGVVRA